MCIHTTMSITEIAITMESIFGAHGDAFTEASVRETLEILATAETWLYWQTVATEEEIEEVLLDIISKQEDVNMDGLC